ncbi:MAG: Maf family protein [Thermomicrobiales bacterium]
MTDFPDEAPPIILASGSPRRRELLTRLGISFTVATSGVEETLDESIPTGEAVSQLALRKADAVARDRDRGLVIGADTVVVCDDTVLGKPHDSADAACMLRLLRDRWHEVITGVAVVDAAIGRTESSAVHTRVRMRAFTDDEIASYVATGEPLDKAGAYAVQGAGGALVFEVDGSYTNVVGLPLRELARMLRRFGAWTKTAETVCVLPNGVPYSPLSRGLKLDA